MAVGPPLGEREERGRKRGRREGGEREEKREGGRREGGKEGGREERKVYEFKIPTSTK